MRLCTGDETKQERSSQGSMSRGNLASFRRDLIPLLRQEGKDSAIHELRFIKFK